MLLFMLMLVVPFVKAETVSSSTEVAAEVDGGGGASESSCSCSASECSESSSSWSLGSDCAGCVVAVGVLLFVEA